MPKAKNSSKSTALATVDETSGELSAASFEEAIEPQAVQLYEIDATTAGEVEEIVYIHGFPLEYRCDAKIGQFKLGEEQEIGKQLSMHVVRAVNFEASLFDYPRQSWLQLFFVDQDKALSHILLKGKETLRAFQQLLLKLRISKLALVDVYIIANWKKREADIKDKDTGKKEHVTYYSLEFSYVDAAPDEIDAAKAFLGRNTLVNIDLNSALARSNS